MSGHDYPARAGLDDPCTERMDSSADGYCPCAVTGPHPRHVCVHGTGWTTSPRPLPVIEAEMRELTVGWPPSPGSGGVGIRRVDYDRYLALVREHKDAALWKTRP